MPQEDWQNREPAEVLPAMAWRRPGEFEEAAK